MPPSLFALFYFSDRVSFLPGQALNHDPFTYTSPVAEITGMFHQAQSSTLLLLKIL
jgi:hypothetical protein